MADKSCLQRSFCTICCHVVRKVNNRKHTQTHLNDKCVKCGFTSPDTEIMTNHLQTHLLDWFECLLCSDIFPSMALYKLHIEQHSKVYFIQSMTFGCSICHASFPSSMDFVYMRLQQHEEQHNTEQQIKERNANVIEIKPQEYSISTQADIRDSLRNLSGDSTSSSVQINSDASDCEEPVIKEEMKDKAYECSSDDGMQDTADMDFTNENILTASSEVLNDTFVALGKKTVNSRVREEKDLYNILKGSAEGTYPCLDCLATFHTEKEIQTHIEVVHPTLDKMLLSKGRLRKETSKTTELFCTICSKSYKQKHALKKHLVAKHSQVKDATESAGSENNPEAESFNMESDNPVADECNDSETVQGEETGCCEDGPQKDSPTGSPMVTDQCSNDRQEEESVDNDGNESCSSTKCKTRNFNKEETEKTAESSESKEPTEVHPCPLCKLKFGSIEDLDIHAKEWHSDEMGRRQIFACKLCNNDYHTPASMRKHLEKVHKLPECEHFNNIDAVGFVDEDQVTKSRTTGKKRAKTTKDERKKKKVVKDNFEHQHGIPCKLCSEVFSTRTRYNKHQQKEHGAPAKQNKTHTKLSAQLQEQLGVGNFNCPLCNKTLVNMSKLKVHLANVHAKRGETVMGMENVYDPVIDCKFCKMEFHSFTARHDHVRDIHPESYNEADLRLSVPDADKSWNFVCNECTKGYQTIASIERHMKEHENPVECKTCHSTCLNRFRLRRHMNDNSCHRCDVCGNQFGTPGRLKKHMLSHTGERAFQCNECGKTFGTKGYLKIHLRIHTGEKPYQCKICPAKFNMNGQLRKHELVHTDKRRFLCSICGKGFKLTNHLQDHMRTHTKERFECPLCKYKSKYKVNLEKHLKVHEKRGDSFIKPLVGITPKVQTDNCEAIEKAGNPKGNKSKILSKGHRKGSSKNSNSDRQVSTDKNKPRSSSNLWEMDFDTSYFGRSESDDSKLNFDELFTGHP